MNMIANAVRRIQTMFPESFVGAKHNHAFDYGWPTEVTFQMLLAMYRRNGLGTAAANKTTQRTWETIPAIWESAEPTESKIESEIRQRFTDLRAWQSLIECDKRSYVGGYAGLILRLADNKRFSEPVDRVPGGLDGLVEIIPAWAGQLKVAQWDVDETSDTYGKPVMYQFNENAVQSTTGDLNTHTQFRQFNVHPDRVIIWSKDGTVYAPSDLEPGYNDLIDIEKIKGAGGEGFWRNSKAAPVIEVDKDARIEDLASMMGVSVDKVQAAIGEQVGDFNKGFDNILMLAGMKANAVNVSLPIPEHFFGTSVQSFAASVSMPVRVLIGNQTGERASTEDQKEFSRFCMARRELIVIPTIRELLNRLERFAIIPERDYSVGWDSLLDAGPSEQMARAKDMAEINSKAGDPLTGSEITFTNDEIREAAGYKPLDEIDEGSE